MTKTVPAILLVLLCLPHLAFSGDNPRNITAVRITTPPKIDGVLDEAVWQLATPATDFIQSDPSEGKPESERTEVRVLYDDEALYFGCTFHDSEPNKIVARLTRRDDEIESDHMEIHLDTYHDHQTGVEFTFNAAGVKTDILQYDDGNSEDNSWDPVWYIETRITPDGWVAEIKIPFNVLRYRSLPDTAENIFGINLIRYISRKQETDYWAFTPKSETGFISRFGHLRGLRGLPTPRQLALLPFVVVKQQNNVPPGANQPSQFLGNGGGDIKYGVASNFTLDATINPDFGEVEADPAVLNLSTYPTFYPEKRPFFIEGSQILHFTTFGDVSGPGMFYSRRIGRAISPDEVNLEGGYIQTIPAAVSILGAAKLTGKTNSGLSVGVLEAATQEEDATIIDSTGHKDTQVLEPFANYSVVRLKQDLFSNSSIGLISTLTTKDSREPAFTNGLDCNLVFDNTYSLYSFIAVSRALNLLDSLRGTGSSGKLQFSKIADKHWLWYIDADYTSPSYDIDDLGFFFSPDDRGTISQLTYKEDQPADVMRNWSVNAQTHHRWNFEGANLYHDYTVTGSGLFMNYWGFSGGITNSHGLYDERESRGNGLYGKPVQTTTNVSIYSDSRSDVILNLGGAYNWDGNRANESDGNIGLTLRPISWSASSVFADYDVVLNQQAWAQNTTSGAIFSDRSTRRYNFTLNNTTTFTRELTLQVYAQLFFAKVHYADLRQLDGPYTFIAVQDPSQITTTDLNEQTLNINVVLRWEYLPGSTLYLVWSQARYGSDEVYLDTFGENLDNTFQVTPSNVLLLKVSYWWSI
jgi:hypothetical protein